MSLPLLEKPLFQVGGHYVTFLGLIAFAALLTVGVIIARILQSDVVRRILSRFKLDNNFIAIVTTILSLAALVFFTVSAVNAAGVSLYWNAPLPGITLSLLQIFLLIALLIAVFWLSSRTKRFLFTRFLVKSGLDRALQHAIAQIVGYAVLIIGIVIVLDNAGIHLGALTLFAGAVGVAYGGDANKVREALIAAAREHPATLNDPPPNAYLEKFGDSTIDFEVIAWSERMSYKPRRFKSELNFLIEKHLREAGVEIPNPQRDLHIRDGVIKVKTVTERETGERSEA